MRLVYLAIIFYLTTLTNYFSQNSSYNRFSVETNLGFTSPLLRVSDGLSIKKFGLFHFDVGSRFMLNRYLGAKVDVSLDRFTGNGISQENLGYSFQTVYLRLSAQGVVNVGRLVHLEKFTEDFSLLVHFGGGVSSLRNANTKWLKYWTKNHADEMLNLMVGITPQYKLNDKNVIHLNVNFITHLFQDYNFDFSPGSINMIDPRGLNGLVINSSIGYTHYLGRKSTHLDWKIDNVAPFRFKKRKLKDLHETAIRLGDKPRPKPEIFDRDKDGVPDSLDLCPDIFGLKKYKGCPEPEIEEMECLIKEYPTITFDASSAVVSAIDKIRLDSLAACLKADQSKKLIIYGHSDNIGDPVFIEDISYRRAVNVKRILTQNGIQNERLVAVSGGAQKAKISDNDYQQIKHNRVAYFDVIVNNSHDIKDLKTGVSLQGLFYTIQMGVYKGKIADNPFEQFGRALYAELEDGKVRYSVGVFKTIQEAKEHLEVIKKSGLYSDVFVTAYYLGDRIPIKVAIELYNERGDGILEK
jgi:OmpA-OmpF porin, OOP family